MLTDDVAHSINYDVDCMPRPLTPHYKTRSTPPNTEILESLTIQSPFTFILL